MTFWLPFPSSLLKLPIIIGYSLRYSGAIVWNSLALEAWQADSLVPLMMKANQYLK